MAWTKQTSKRKQELPTNWKQIRQQIIARDKHNCVLCGAKGTDVDHIIRGNNHSLTNLRLLCRSCHMKRTGKDGGKAKRQPRRQHRKAENHPAYK